MRASRFMKQIIRFAVGGWITAVCLLTLYWVVIGSVRPLGLAPKPSVIWWPEAFVWQNYATLFEVVQMARYLVNSLIVVAVAVPITLLVASWAGFALSQLPNPARRRLVLASLALMLVPATAVWLYRYQILRAMGLIDTLGALFIPAFGGSNPLFILLFYWAFRRIPRELFEAAKLDAAGLFVLWRAIAMPLVRPATLAVTVLTFLMYWSDFNSPVLYIYRTRWYTLPVGLQLLRQLDSTNTPLLMAATVLMTAPVLLLFGWLQWVLNRQSEP